MSKHLKDTPIKTIEILTGTVKLSIDATESAYIYNTEIQLIDSCKNTQSIEVNSKDLIKLAKMLIETIEYHR